MTFATLLHELADPATSPDVSALIGLSAMGPEQASQFMDAWVEMELRQRRWLIEELIGLAEENVDLNFDAAFFIALTDKDAEVRTDAIRGLWEYEGRDLIDALLGLLAGDADAGVRAEAAQALGRFALLAELDRLRETDTERIDAALARAARDSGEVAEVRGRALEALGARSEEWVRGLLYEAHSAADRRLRLSAVHAMGRSCDASFLEDVIAELDSDDGEMRFEAAGALGTIADERAVPHLIRLLEDDDREVREAAIGALGEIGGEEARESLQTLLESDDERTRDAATAALAEVQFAEDPLAFPSGP